MNKENHILDQNAGAAIGIVLSVQTGKIVLVKNIHHKYPLWRIPGGTIKTEISETPKDAFIREIKEETGLQLDQEATLFLMRVISGTKKPHYYHVFAGFVNDFSKLDNGPTPETDSDAILIAKEFTIEEIASKAMLPPHFIMLREGIKNICSL